MKLENKFDDSTQELWNENEENQIVKLVEKHSIPNPTLNDATETAFRRAFEKKISKEVSICDDDVEKAAEPEWKKSK